MADYALYHGESFIDIGSIQYLAKLLNVKPDTIRFYKSKSWQKRSPNGYALVKLEDE